VLSSPRLLSWYIPRHRVNPVIAIDDTSPPVGLLPLYANNRPPNDPSRRPYNRVYNALCTDPGPNNLTQGLFVYWAFNGLFLLIQQLAFINPFVREKLAIRPLIREEIDPVLERPRRTGVIGFFRDRFATYIVLSRELLRMNSLLAKDMRKEWDGVMMTNESSGTEKDRFKTLMKAYYTKKRLAEKTEEEKLAKMKSPGK
jgi:hypothetical protein